MSAGVVPVPGPSDASPGEPEIANIGGDQPPMEFTPVPSAVKVAPPRPSSTRPVVTPPPHSNPVVTPETAQPRESVVATTVMPSVSLPTISSLSPPSSTSAESSVP
ncbi:hypothetical protein [Lentzea kentuckyensis]|uniref:hypothetical protein n=1 Tax=Lentzea kentuckyensis TaxID=360086 RepID=UPI001179C4C3|nr:hypothetical protein [Lentzea kentuckyensis]